MTAALRVLSIDSLPLLFAEYLMIAFLFLCPCFLFTAPLLFSMRGSPLFCFMVFRRDFCVAV